MLARLPGPYLEDLRRWCARWRLELRVLEDAAEAIDPGAPPVLWLLHTSGDSAAMAVPWIRTRARRAPVVVLGEKLSVEGVVALVKAGAADVLAVPAPPAATIARAMRHARVADAAPPAGELVGRGPAMARLRRAVAAAARTGSTVLLSGETGSGKGLVAREIHRGSGRRRGPFVTADCASFAATVIESELFGHERGAFTGAVASHPGRFERAQGGTLFLDEVGDLAPPLQAKLLRVLQDGEYERVGGSETRRSDARIVAATHRDLPREVEAGRFRADLLFRLHVFHIRVPPLRERREDLRELVEAGLRRLQARFDGAPPQLEDACLGPLRSHPWPGNVRELVNLLERLYIEHGGRVVSAPEVEKLLDESPLRPGPGGREPAAAAAAAASERCDATPGESELERIVAVLQATRWNVSLAARRLGLARSTLRYRMRRYDLV